MFITGIAVPFTESPLMVFRSEKVEQKCRGRVFSIANMAMTLIMPSAWLFGPLSDAVPIRWLMVGSGIGQPRSRRLSISEAILQPGRTPALTPDNGSHTESAR